MTSSESVVTPPLPIWWEECETREVVVTIDFPPKELMPNRANGKHWAASYKHKTAYRDAAYWKTTMVARAFETTPDIAGMEVHYVMPDKRWRDTDNLLAATKAGIDGMAKALNIDDKIINPLVVFRHTDPEQPRVVIKLIFGWRKK